MDNTITFNSVYKKYNLIILNTCIKKLYNYNDALDVSQEIFLSIYKDLDKFEGRSKLSTWIYAVTFNAIRNFWKFKKAKCRGNILKNDINEYKVIDNKYNPEKIYEDNSFSNEIINQFNNVKKYKFYDAIYMREIEHKEYKEIADILNISIGTVKSRINRARECLKFEIRKKELCYL